MLSGTTSRLDDSSWSSTEQCERTSTCLQAHTFRRQELVPSPRQELTSLSFIYHSQEVLDHPCDIGSDILTLKRKILDEFPAIYPCINTNTLPADWNDKVNGPYAFAPAVTADFTKPRQRMYGAAMTQARASRVRQSLKERREDLVIIVTHQQFIGYLMGDPNGVSSPLAGTLSPGY